MTYHPASTLVALTPAKGDGPVVVAQLGQTLDGRIATVTGASKYISGREALKHLHRLRAAVDAVIVGVGTVAADDPQLTVRLTPGDSPARVVIDPKGRMQGTARLLADGAARVIVITGPDGAAPDGVETLRLPLDASGAIAPGDIVAALNGMGLTRLLVEGGADTLARFLDADAVDLLHVLVAPMILGSGKAGFALRPVAALKDAIRPKTRVHAFEDGDVLFTCDLRERAQDDG